MTTSAAAMTGRIPDDHWARRPVLVLDTESTGVDVETAEIALISVGVMDLASPLRTKIETEYLAVEMPAEAGAVNGLTTDILRERARPGLSSAEVLSIHAELIADHLSRGLPVIAANAPYDFTVLDRDCRRHGVATVGARLDVVWEHIGPVIDPIVLDKRVEKYRRRVSETQGARCLKTLCQVHGCGWDDELAHTSGYDALQAGRVVAAIVAKYPLIRNYSLSQLHRAQVGWYEQQSIGLRDYFVRESANALSAAGIPGSEEYARLTAKSVELAAKAASVSTAWPIVPYEQAAPAPPTRDIDPRAFAQVCQDDDCGCSGLAHP